MGFFFKREIEITVPIVSVKLNAFLIPKSNTKINAGIKFVFLIISRW